MIHSIRTKIHSIISIEIKVRQKQTKYVYDKEYIRLIND